MQSNSLSARRHVVLGALVIALTALAMAAWTWRMWADPIIDFGGEAYLAWRLAEGDVLYRDLANFIGPLGSYAQSLWMRFFGASLGTVAFANLAQLALILALLYRLCLRLSDVVAATSACVAFTILCAFALHSGAGNYNFIWPYSQDLPLAFALSLLALNVAAAWVERPRTGLAIALGVCAGLVVLTKVEITVALGAALVALLGAASAPMPMKSRHALVALVAALAVFAAAWGALTLAMPASEALLGALGSWPHALGDAGDFPLYRYSMGLEPLGFHLTRIASWAAGTFAAVAALSWIAARWGTLAGALSGVGLAAALFAALPWNDAFYPLSLYMVGAAFMAWRARRSDGNGALRVAWCVFAAVLLLRMALNARVQFYGFALAAPGLTVLVVTLLAWLPSHRGSASNAVRAALAPLVAVVIAAQLLAMAQGRRWNTLELGVGADRMLVSPRGQFLPEALAWVEERCPQDGTLLVLPEGAMLNYLARRRSPTRYFNFMPPELAMYGEAQMLAALRSAPPDMILLIHRDTSEYGVPSFGRDYGAQLYEWVKANYRATKLWSLDPKERPFEPGTRHAIAALERKR